jgi:hypothetical protein
MGKGRESWARVCRLWQCEVEETLQAEVIAAARLELALEDAGRLLLRPVGHRRRRPIQPRRVCLGWVVAEPRRAARGDLTGRRPAQWRPLLLLGFSPLPSASGVRGSVSKGGGWGRGPLVWDGRKHTLVLLAMGLYQWA